MLSAEGLIKSLPLYLRTFWLKKSNPLSMFAMLVLASVSLSPHCFRKDSMAGLTLLSSNCLESPITTKSSAYRMMLIIERILPSNRRRAEALAVGSNPSSTILAIMGDMMPLGGCLCGWDIRSFPQCSRHSAIFEKLFCPTICCPVSVIGRPINEAALKRLILHRTLYMISKRKIYHITQSCGS